MTVTRKGAWFTNSLRAGAVLRAAQQTWPGLEPSRRCKLSGPAAQLSGAFNLNGIRAAHHGRTLIVAHTATGALYTVDPGSGASAAIAGISVPNVDGIELSGRRLWAVQNASNQISRIRLNKDLTAGVVVKVITSDLLPDADDRSTVSARSWRSSTRSSTPVSHRLPTSTRSYSYAPSSAFGAVPRLSLWSTAALDVPECK